MSQVKHPGARLKELLEERGWSQADLIFVLRCVPKTVNQIINGKQGISPAMSLMLGDALGLPPNYFADLQTKYEIEMAERPDPAIGARAKVIARYPIREMIKRGWIQNDRPDELESQLCRFFGTNSLDAISDIPHSAKKTSYGEITGAQLAWLFRVRSIATGIDVPRYNPEKLRAAVDEFSKLRIEAEAVRHVPKLLYDAGVRFVVVEALAGSKIDGACFWLDRNSPVIGMTFRFDRIDNFWFVLRHECAHVLHGHGKDDAILDSDLESDNADSLPEEERIANAEAAEFCLAQQKLLSFIERKKPFFAERDILAFSSIQKIHPGIAVGQLHRALNKYDLLRKYLVRVRKHLAMAMMMDGWGDNVPTDH